MSSRHTTGTSSERAVVGRNASVFKYDILTALLVTAGQGAPDVARLCLRLSMLITARYNWQRGDFAVGRREIARLWGVTERTAKRDMAQMRARGWVRVLVPAARGRVARYELVFESILRDTEAGWSAVGPDYVARMVGTPEPAPPASNVVPLHPAPALPEVDDFGWHRVAAQLAEEDPAVYAAWFASLSPVALEGGHLVLHTSNRFKADYITQHHATRLLRAARRAGCAVESLSICPSA